MGSSNGSFEKPLPERPLPKKPYRKDSASVQARVGAHRPFVTFKDTGLENRQIFWSNSSTCTLEHCSTDNLATSEPVCTNISNTKRSFVEIVRRWWPQEAASWVAGLLCYAAITAVLFAYDGKPIPRLPFGITLNALISVLATLGVFFLMVPIASGLSQTKWIWFTNAKPLIDFEVIECASRGPGGALLLILRRRGGGFAIVGSLLTILLVATGPFVQQVVQFAQKPLSSPNASVPIATIYNTSSLFPGALNDPASTASPGTVDLDTKAAFYDGALTSSAKTFDVTPSCPGGNCTWEHYETLSFCSECKRVARPHEFSYVPSYQVWAFPAKQILTSVYLNNSISGPTWRPKSAFEDYPGPILSDIFIVADDGLPGPDYNNIDECVLTLCVKTFRSTYEHGVFKEFEISTTMSPFNWTDEHTYLRNLSHTGSDIDKATSILMFHDYNLTITPADSGNTFTVTRETVGILVSWLQLTLTCTSRTQGALNSNGIIQAVAFAGATIFDAYAGSYHDKPYMVKEWVGNLAASLSRSMRMQPNSGGSAIRGSAPGTSYTYSEPLVQVRWVWMTYPITVLVLGMTFYASVFQTTKAMGAPRWKDNTVAPLLHGVDEAAKAMMRAHGYGPANRLDEMEYAARRTKVRLAKVEEKSWHFVGCENV